MSKKAGIVVFVVVALVVTVGAVLGERWLNPRYDRVAFSGGDRHKRIAVGDFVMAIRHKNQRELLRLSGENSGHADPQAIKGANWLIANYSDRLNAPVRVTYGEPPVSSLEVVACLSFGKGDGDRLSMSGLTEATGRPYEISLVTFPVDSERAQPDRSQFCNGL